VAAKILVSLQMLYCAYLTCGPVKYMVIDFKGVNLLNKWYTCVAHELSGLTIRLDKPPWHPSGKVEAIVVHCS